MRAWGKASAAAADARAGGAAAGSVPTDRPGFDFARVAVTLAVVFGLGRMVVVAGLLAGRGVVEGGDWPQWRGPRRDGVCEETGLRQEWPEGGPPLLWKSSGLGRGYCAPVVVGPRLYLAGDVGEELHLFALDGEGRLVWKAKNGRAWTGPYPGARASCAVHEGRVYHLNAHGRLACFEAGSGAELWAVDVRERFGGKEITWGLSEGVLVDGRRVVVTAGGDRALVAALDTQTGQTVWASEPLVLGPTTNAALERLAEPAGEVDNASYASPILLELGGRRLVVGCSLRHMFGADADNGALVWSRPLPTRYGVIVTTPVRVGEAAVFGTAPDGDGGRLYRLRLAGSQVRVETGWRTELDTCQGGVVYAEGTLFGAMYRRGRTWLGLDATTGAVRHRLEGFAKGQVLYADKRLYCVSEEGEVALLQPSGAGFAFRGRFRLLPERKNDVWAHPVIAHGRLYLRHHETLFCYDLAAR